ncbi:MAG: hypothetical protein U9R48_01925 [Chloroflexota bacterium]|nr:hypothetical protein [Chloroflexota bacterium]
MSSYLQDFGIARTSGGRAVKVFERLFPDIFAIECDRPSEYVGYCWEKYQTSAETSNALNGLIFEYLLATALIRWKLLPLYIQARAAFVPNVDYDLLLYTDRLGPIALSAKTSLRERYKQADLEAIALKYVHRRAQIHLITLDAHEAASVKRKIQNGDVIGIDSVVVATEADFDDLMGKLQELQFTRAPTVSVIKAQSIVTLDRIERRI